ncbi:type IV pilus modification protein PilV [Rheinheimera sp. D18]|uniref:type IV pilus modification protein PilV n=1 Tax=Rheinheimera sp. D18 TaxID=2545632 RepID=UPI00104FE918|nr:type IV pilus modification protein PilV [Rheinheimera sp. D18]QBL10195.1 type IV pilus modification protein PilV [Rheinheimera sp. D18]
MRIQHGFSLIEVLITLLVLKVGLLGLLAAQTLSLRQLQDAIQRTQAVAMSNALFNEIWANPRLADAIAPQITLQFEPLTTPVCSQNTPCNAQQLAIVQLNSWFETLQALSSTLHQPVFCFQSQANTAQLQVSWQQRSANSAPQLASCDASAGRGAFAVQGGAW